MKKHFSVISLLLLAVITINAQQTDFSKLSGPYLGQKSPGIVPEVFAMGIVSSIEYVDFKLTFSPDGIECYFYRLSDSTDELIPTMFFTKIENGVWTKPVPFPLTQGIRTFHPCISHDNQWLFFEWQFGRQENCPSGIYVSKRNETGWSSPAFAGKGGYMSSDKNGNLYINEFVWGENPKFYITKVDFTNGQFSNYQRTAIQPHHEVQWHPCISPDGAYILYDYGVENGGLFVSFKDKNGQWGEGIHLTKHGFNQQSRGAYISPDGKYLFFSYNGDIWWVSTKIIDNLRKEALKNEK